MSAPVQVSSMFRRIGVKVALRSGWIARPVVSVAEPSSRWATDLTIRREHQRHFCPNAFRPVTVLLVFIAAMIGLAACSGGGAQQSVKLELAPASVLPPEIQQAEPKVREAYQFAVANQDYLTNFPCYCGCGGMGHQNNRDCYIDEVKADGTIVFESHAFLWGVCVDITRDVMRMTEEGKSTKEIRAYIDATYSKFGPPTDTEPVN